MDRFHSTAISKESSIVFRKPIFNSARCSTTKSSSDCTERRKQQQQPVRIDFCHNWTLLTLQNNTLQSFRTKEVPWPGYIGDEQK